MLELDWIAKGRTATRALSSTALVRPREAVAWAVALVAVLAAARLRSCHSAATAVDATRFVVSPPPGTTIVAENTTRMALSPDGRQLAFVERPTGQQQIWIRSLDSVSAEPLAGTDGAVSPFWSPDSRFIGFFSPGDGELKKVECRADLPGHLRGANGWGAHMGL